MAICTMFWTPVFPPVCPPSPVHPSRPWTDCSCVNCSYQVTQIFPCWRMTLVGRGRRLGWRNTLQRRGKVIIDLPVICGMNYVEKHVGKFKLGPILWRVERTESHAGWTERPGKLGHLTRKEEVRMTHKLKTTNWKTYFCLTGKIGQRNTILFNFISYVTQKKHWNKYLWI